MRAWRPPTVQWPTLCGLCHSWEWSRLCGHCLACCAPACLRCSRCALPTASGQPVCGRCLREPPPGDAAIASLDYRHPWDRLLACFKFHGALDLADTLTGQLHAPVARAGAFDPRLMLPAPLGADRSRERGYNQAWELTHCLVRRQYAPADATLPLKLRHTAAQMDLPISERAANLRNAFAVEPPRRRKLQGRTVTLVDDVMTSGATAGEITQVLRAAGDLRVQVLALARTPPPGESAAPPKLACTDNAAMFNIVLVHPEIPPNTGNVIRLAANTGCRLHLVEPLGFSMDNRLLQRAGLDYHEYAEVERHPDWDALRMRAAAAGGTLYAFTTRGSRPLADIAWQPGDWLVFGCETAGLPEAVRESFPAAQRVRLPMRPGQRSLNLSNAVAVAVFEAWRSQGYAGAT